MTPAQQREVRRLTRNMWELLLYAAKFDPPPGPPISDECPGVGGGMLTTARILERRGFIAINPPKRPRYPHVVALTDAGREALTSAPKWMTPPPKGGPRNV